MSGKPLARVSPRQWDEITSGSHAEQLAGLLAQATKTRRRPGQMDAQNRIDRHLWLRSHRPLTEAENEARPRCTCCPWEEP